MAGNRKHDVALIRTLSTYTPRIVIVLTKVDLVSETERQEVIEFVGGELRGPTSYRAGRRTPEGQS